jgi:hypothetical protein
VATKTAERFSLLSRKGEFTMKGFIVVGCLAAASLFAACGGRSAPCQKALDCGTAVTSVGAAEAKTAVETCESVSLTADLCCDTLRAGYAIGGAGGADGGSPAACQ